MEILTLLDTQMEDGLPSSKNATLQNMLQQQQRSHQTLMSPTGAKPRNQLLICGDASQTRSPWSVMAAKTHGTHCMKNAIWIQAHSSKEPRPALQMLKPLNGPPTLPRTLRLINKNTRMKDTHCNALPTTITCAVLKTLPMEALSMDLMLEVGTHFMKSAILARLISNFTTHTHREQRSTDGALSRKIKLTYSFAPKTTLTCVSRRHGMRSITNARSPLFHNVSVKRSWEWMN